MNDVCRVELIPPNKNVIFLRHPDNTLEKFPRKDARHVRQGDVVRKYRTGPMIRLKIIIDEDVVEPVDTDT